jgi:hypothetical protein
VFAGLAWIFGELIAHQELLPISMLGASGGIAAVLILFCLNFPHERLYIWGVLPMPAWLLAVIFVGQDLVFAIERRPDDRVAFTAHLGGALFALLYYRSGFRLARWLPESWSWPRLRPRPKLRVHEPDEEDERPDSDVVDNILRKIQEQGQDSLTRQERQILEEASREYQRRRR